MIDFVNRVIKTTMHAGAGVWYGFYSKRNLIFLLFGAFLFVLTVIFIPIDLTGAALILFAWLLVIIVEVINSGVEEIVNIVSPHYNPKYGKVKDILAGAVLLSCICALTVTALVLYGPMSIRIADITSK